jgi:hypothetical protein
MLKEITYVPQDKCPLDVLAEMGEKTRHAWIYLHANAIAKLLKTVDSIDENSGNKQYQYTWNATEKYPRTVLTIDNSSYPWFKVKAIDASDIIFRNAPSDPNDIFFIKMEE